MLKALMITYQEELARPKRTFYSPVSRCLAGLRILLFPDITAQFYSIRLVEKLRHLKREHDPLYFLVHNYYISNKFTLRQRVEVAMTHHKHELRAYNCDYAREIYGSDGIRLWRRSFNGHHFTIVLTASPDNRYEGDLTVTLYVNDISLCRMSFCYLNANIFGQASDMTMLISRNQTDSTSVRELFDRFFKHNAPQFFCLSAVCGIAIANGFKTMFAIKHDAQIAYEERLDFGFRNSYTHLWEKFDAVEIERHVYMLNVPLKLRPVELVNRAHRRRARARRGNWEEIIQSTRESMVKYTGESKATVATPHL